MCFLPFPICCQVVDELRSVCSAAKACNCYCVKLFDWGGCWYLVLYELFVIGVKKGANYEVTEE